MLQNEFNMSKLSLKYFKHFCFPKIKTSLKSHPEFVVDAITHSMDQDELKKKFKENSHNIITASKIYVKIDHMLTLKKMIGLFIVKELSKKNLYSSDMLNPVDIPLFYLDDSLFNYDDDGDDDSEDNSESSLFAFALIPFLDNYIKKIFEIDFYNNGNKIIQGQLWILAPVLKLLDVKVTPPEMTFEQFKKDVIDLIETSDTL
ncbi:hypothetical protein [Melioribacter sp. OK-6-Me]|uniref:hypothetical protein n=1 Tax=unclassified Melioribacter TaxID=2627329 RepID=UPI003ED9E4B0